MIEIDTTKIIFLDVDGVLNEHRGEDATRNKTPDGFVGVEDKYLLQLMLIVEFTGASIVLSSDWKDEFGDNLCTYDDASNDGRYLLNRLSEFGLSIYERTDDRSIGTDMSTGRGYGIRKFLKSHPEVENYVILDDIPFSDFNGELKECDEGSLYWVNKRDIFNLNLWEGDKYFLEPLMNSNDIINLKMYYDGDRLINVIK